MNNFRSKRTDADRAMSIANRKTWNKNWRQRYGDRPISGTHVLIECEVRFRVSGDPLAAWIALCWCLGSRFPLPDWLHDYFFEVSGEITNISRIKKGSPAARRNAVLRALGLHRSTIFKHHLQDAASLDSVRNMERLRVFRPTTKDKEFVLKGRSERTKKTRLSRGRAISMAIKHLVKKYSGQ